MSDLDVTMLDARGALVLFIIGVLIWIAVAIMFYLERRRRIRREHEEVMRALDVLNRERR